MEKYKNSIEIGGNIASISDIKKNTQGKDFCYVSIVQNSRTGKASYYSIYLEDKFLKQFQEDGYQKGDYFHIIGKLQTYQKENKTAFQLRPYEIVKFEKSNTKENSNTEKEVDM